MADKCFIKPSFVSKENMNDEASIHHQSHSGGHQQSGAGYMAGAAGSMAGGLADIGKNKMVILAMIAIIILLICVVIWLVMKKKVVPKKKVGKDPPPVPVPTTNPSSGVPTTPAVPPTTPVVPPTAPLNPPVAAPVESIVPTKNIKKNKNSAEEPVAPASHDDIAQTVDDEELNKYINMETDDKSED